MSEYDTKILDVINHYQDALNRYVSRGEEPKILHCLDKLRRLPITVAHLEETGVGRSVNALRKVEGDVGEAARRLVTQWKEMVEQHAQHDSDNEDAEDNEEHSGLDVNNSHYKDDRKSSGKKNCEGKSKSERSGKKNDKSSGKSKRKHEECSSRGAEGDWDGSEDQKKRKPDEISSKNKKHRETSAKNKEKYSEKERKDKNKRDEQSGESKKSTENTQSRNKDEIRPTSSKIGTSSSKIVNEKLKNVDSIDSGSGASFGEALGMLETIKSGKKKSIINKSDAKSSGDVNKRKLTPEKCAPAENNAELGDVLPQNVAKFDPLEINISSLLPALTPNYRPVANNPLLNENPRHKALAEYESLSNVTTSKNARTKVYSGNKMAFVKIPSLFELCTRILMDNIDALEYTGGVPYMILKPVLDKCTPEQLSTLEHYNPYLIEDTDGLWHFHCQKEFRNKKREEWESWREMYNRCIDERAAKLRALTANIKQSQDKCVPVRQTKLAYVDSDAKPPRSVARKQQRNGYVGDVKLPLVTPSSRLSALAQCGGAVAHAGPRAAILGGGSNAVMKIKKAPLMQKTLQLMKGRFRR